MFIPSFWLPGSSAGKESTCNAGDPGLIPGLGRSLGEGIGFPLQCSWVSMVVQTVKSPPVMRETWVQSLRWEDPLEEGLATHSSVLAWRIPMDRGAWQAPVFLPGESPWTEEPGGLQSMGLQRVRHDWATQHTAHLHPEDLCLSFLISSSIASTLLSLVFL